MNLDHQQKVNLVVVASVEHLIDKDVLRGPRLLSVEGRAEARRLQEEEGFIPTVEEAQAVMTQLLSLGAVEPPM